jgi:hypothetical protein
VANNALQALANDEYVKVSADTQHGKLDDTGIDAWELKASRRALANLRELLYGQPMLDLIDHQLEEADRLYREYIAASDGKWAATQVILTIEGLSSSQFFPVLGQLIQSAAGSEQERRKMSLELGFPAHPEHYAIPPFVGAVETMGGIPSRTRIARTPAEEAPDFVKELFDESYPMKMTGKGELVDGTPHSFVLQQFRDTPGGMEANLWIWYAAACPPIYLAEHAEHYTIEFRNGLRLAAARINAEKSA